MRKTRPPKATAGIAPGSAAGKISARAESEMRYRDLIQAMNEGAAILDADGIILYGNPRFARILRTPRSKVPGTSLEQFVVEADRTLFRSLLSQASRGSGRSQVRLIASGRRPRPVHLSLRRMNAQAHDPATRAPLITLVATDIGERLRDQDLVRQTNEQLTRWIGELELRNQEITLLSEMVNLFQACRTPAEAYAVMAQYTQQLFPDEAGALYVLNEPGPLLERAAAWGAPLPLQNRFEPAECWALRRGRLYLVQDPQSPMVCGHRRGLTPTSYLCVPMVAQGEALGILTLQPQPHGGGDIRPLSGSKQQLAITVAEHIALALANLQLRQALRQQAIRDPLTNLYNRRYMEETLERELYRAGREQASLGIIMLDIDHFKAFNDRHGHEAGDQLLREVARLLDSHVRKGDIACRYGGEEFTLILPEDTLAGARQRAEDLRAGAQALVIQFHGERLEPITLSFGISVFPDHGRSFDAVLRSADKALYRAKELGRNRVETAEPDGA